jgi:hypothetical protein
MREAAAKRWAHSEYQRRGLPNLRAAEAELRYLFNDRRLKEALQKGEARKKKGEARKKGEVTPTELRAMAPPWLYARSAAGSSQEVMETTAEPRDWVPRYLHQATLEQIERGLDGGESPFPADMTRDERKEMIRRLNIWPR